MEQKKPYIKITKDGPYMVYGLPEISEKIILTDSDGISIKYGDGKTFQINVDPVALCRCGHSKNAPFCDGHHASAYFDGTETAPHTPILQNADVISGPNLDLADNERYCAFARFCDRGGRIWNLVAMGDKAADKLAIEEANLCPAGRLLMFTKSGELLEDKHKKSLHTITDDGLKISGPLWVRGGITVIGANGEAYEVRAKQTLCRCGASSNKPFCNGAHASIKFKAGD